MANGQGTLGISSLCCNRPAVERYIQGSLLLGAKWKGSFNCVARCLFQQPSRISYGSYPFLGDRGYPEIPVRRAIVHCKWEGGGGHGQPSCCHVDSRPAKLALWFGCRCHQLKAIWGQMTKMSCPFCIFWCSDKYRISHAEGRAIHIKQGPGCTPGYFLPHARVCACILYSPETLSLWPYILWLLDTCSSRSRLPVYR